MPLFGNTNGLLMEKRRLAELPALRLQASALAEFPLKFEAYFNDHFPFRDHLIRWNNLAKLRYLGISPHANVTLGKDNWLFLTYEHVGDNPHKSRPFSPTELARCQALIESHTSLLAQKGIRYIFLITPDKQTIYPELYPRKRSIRLNQLLDHMRTHSQATCPDIRSHLVSTKAKQQVYYRTDSHWNEYGAYACYECLSEILRTWFPRVRTVPLSDFEIVAEPSPPYALWYYGDLSWLLGGLADQYTEKWWYLKARCGYRAHKTDEVVPMKAPLGPGSHSYATEQKDSTLPKAVVFHDSFGVRLAPLLSESFHRVVFIPSSQFDPDVIEREKPDVVIFQMVERKLEYTVAPDPEPNCP